MTLTAPALRLRPVLWFAGLLLALLLVEHLVTTLPEFGRLPALSAAVTFDVLAGIPLLYYLLIVRRYRLPVSTVAAVFAAALALGYWLIPTGQQRYLDWASHGLVALEALMLTLAVVNLRRLRRAYREAARRGPDFIDNLHAAFAGVFTFPLGPLVSELAMLRYFLLGWWAHPELGPGQRGFSSHRESGFVALIITLAGLSVIETAAVHLLVGRWSSTAAAVLLVLDLYTLIFLLAHLRAVVLRPLFLEPGQLTVRVGFVWRLRVPLAQVVGAEPLADAPAPDKQRLNLAGPLLTAPNVLLTFAAPVPVTGLYGLRRHVRQVALYVDDRAGLLSEINGGQPRT